MSDIIEDGSRVGEWVALMGEDLQMKVVDQEMTVEHPRVVDVGDALYIDFVARQAIDRDDTSGPVFQIVKDRLVVVGEKDVVPALEMGIRFMKEGETGLIYSRSKYAYGPLGRKQGDLVLPPDADVVYQVVIQKVVKNGDEFANPKFQINIARSKKEIGNDCFQHEWSNGYGKGRILQLYDKGARLMTNLLAENDDETTKKEAMAILVDCMNNIAAVHLKAKEYGKAKESAIKVILRDPDNMKALLRAARAAIYDPAGTFTESEEALKAAEQVNPDDPDLRKLKLELERKKREYEKKSKAIFSLMSSGIKKQVGNSKRKAEQCATADNEDALKSTGVPDQRQIARNLSERRTWKMLGYYLLHLMLPLLVIYFVKIFNVIKDGSRPFEKSALNL